MGVRFVMGQGWLDYRLVILISGGLIYLGYALTDVK